MRSNGEILRRSGGFAASAPQNDNPLRQAARRESTRGGHDGAKDILQELLPKEIHWMAPFSEFWGLGV